eukprot:NODE_828_length_1310_cov_125.574941_g606_i0.p1 GENE.NODE_828_length_1310_cov_125.574941_g606_i0~~NODE_828_length_1310_cov_125.574941_g606_i0.p1  ORF type:complete len:367 (+),score=86.94 NODE_828_length_1310_cov_125.574941_g606_i0:63-1163(+)
MADELIGVQTDDGREFIVDAQGVIPTPQEIKGFTAKKRVQVANVDKVYPNMNEAAEALHFGKWQAHAKVAPKSAGIVIGSMKHPKDPKISVVGIRTESNQDFLIHSEGLDMPPQLCPAFPEGTRVQVTNPDKVYSRMDEAAATMALTKWAQGGKPEAAESGVVLASMKHPVSDGFVVGVRSAKGKDYVVDPDGIAAAPKASTTWVAGTRVRIINIDKLYTKMDEMAVKMCLNRWTAGTKPPVVKTKEEVEAKAEGTEPPAKKPRQDVVPSAAVGEVWGSELHPDGTTMVFGVHTDAGPDFLVAEDGLEVVPNVSKTFPIGTRVKICEGKVFPKWDDKAIAMGLGKWTLGAKPSDVTTGAVMASVAK